MIFGTSHGDQYLKITLVPIISSCNNLEDKLSITYKNLYASWAGEDEHYEINWFTVRQPQLMR